jgi:DNA topoisomerase-1
MATNLVIVESGAKAKIIEKYLNSIPELIHLGKFKVIASLGHIQDLPEKETGIDTSTWTVTYVPMKTKKTLITHLKLAANQVKMVWIASDMDLEGNAIAFHLKNVLHLKKPNYARVIFNEITKSALKTAFLNPGDIDMNMFAAQETRRILDRIVGFELSPLLWRRFATGSLSAGRVQSAGLQMIVARYKNAEQHIPETYWTCEGNFKLSGSVGQDLTATVYSTDSDKIMQWSSSGTENIAYFERFLNKVIDYQNQNRNQKAKAKEPTTWSIDFTTKKSFKNPAAPFTTSTFQQEVYNLYHIPPKVTMQCAQRLYEAGHITYMRTDSVQLSEDAQAALIKYVSQEYGVDHAEAHSFKTKQQNAQEAHEAIRPTDPNVITSQLPEDVSDIDRKIYSLIWRRTVASQMIPAEYLDITYIIKIPSVSTSTYYFRGKTSLLTKEGYLLAYSPDTKVDRPAIALWEKITAGGTASTTASVQLYSLTGSPTVTKAAALYNESTIVKALEKEGIGRPSTYASIIDKLYSRQYIAKGECPQKEVQSYEYKWSAQHGDAERLTKTAVTLTSGGKEKDFLVPSSLGIRVIEYLQPIVPFLLDTAFTSHMESDLDKIMNGTANKNTTLNDFYKIFHSAVEQAQQVAKAAREARVAAVSAGGVAGTADGKLYPKAESILHKYGHSDGNDLLVVKTKYGPALLQVSTSKWYSIKSFIEWKKKTYAEVTREDLTFIMSLPRKIETTDRMITLGPYGLYVKDAQNNYILPEEYWEKAYTNTLDTADIEFIKNLQPKKPSSAKKAPSAEKKSASEKKKPASAARKKPVK